MVVGWEGSTPSPKALIEAPRAPHSQNPASGDLQSPRGATVIWLCSATAPERGMGAVIGATSSATAVPGDTVCNAAACRAGERG